MEDTVASGKHNELWMKEGSLLQSSSDCSFLICQSICLLLTMQHIFEIPTMLKKSVSQNHLFMSEIPVSNLNLILMGG